MARFGLFVGSADFLHGIQSDMAAAKGRVLVQILRRSGMLFMEGTARLEGALLKVGGMISF